jgi:hypothetical protein
VTSVHANNALENTTRVAIGAAGLILSFRVFAAPG